MRRKERRSWTLSPSCCSPRACTPPAIRSHAARRKIEGFDGAPGLQLRGNSGGAGSQPYLGTFASPQGARLARPQPVLEPSSPCERRMAKFHIYLKGMSDDCVVTVEGEQPPNLATQSLGLSERVPSASPRLLPSSRTMITSSIESSLRPVIASHSPVPDRRGARRA